MLKLKLQYFGHLMLGKDSDDGRDWGQEEKGKTDREACLLQFMGSQRVGHD